MQRQQAKHRIGIDLLGSDQPPEAILGALLSYAQEVEHLSFVLLGTPALFKEFPTHPASITYYPVEEVIGMEESPLEAVRSKKNSSLCTGLRLLAQGELDAWISSGNTGALIAGAALMLPAIAGIKRPALLTLLPVQGGAMAVLDVGATMKADVRRLVELAFMGCAYQKSRGIEMPRIALLNTGQEAQKGTPELQEAYQQLSRYAQKKTFAFVGNIEGREALAGHADVLVTDGFTGNIFLKTAEGIAASILDQLQEMSLTNKTQLDAMRARLGYTEYPGAVICGVDRLVIKCHGSALPQHVIHSIRTAVHLLDHQFLQKIKIEMSGFLVEKEN